MSLETDGKVLKVKVKISPIKGCFGGYHGINFLISETEINIEQCYNTKKSMEGYHSLTFNRAPAGKIYLKITPISKWFSLYYLILPYNISLLVLYKILMDRILFINEKIC